MEKKCTRCQGIKPLACFYFDKRRGQHKTICRDCIRDGYVKQVRKAKHESVLVRGMPEVAAHRIADMAARRSVVVMKAGNYYRVMAASRLVGIYDAGCDYRDVLREIA